MDIATYLRELTLEKRKKIEEHNKKIIDRRRELYEDEKNRIIEKIIKECIRCKKYLKRRAKKGKTTLECIEYEGDLDRVYLLYKFSDIYLNSYRDSLDGAHIIKYRKRNTWRIDIIKIIVDNFEQIKQKIYEEMDKNISIKYKIFESYRKNQFGIYVSYESIKIYYDWSEMVYQAVINQKNNITSNKQISRV